MNIDRLMAIQEGWDLLESGDISKDLAKDIYSALREAYYEGAVAGGMDTAIFEEAIEFTRVKIQ